MNGKRILLAIGLLLLAPTQLLADPPDVDIQLIGPDHQKIKVSTHATAFCWGTEDCPTELTFRWKGFVPPQGEGEDPPRIKIRYKPGLYWDGLDPAQIPATACLEFPGGENPFYLEKGKDQTLIFRQESPDCMKKDKVFYFYEIYCVGGAGDDCGGVKALDPGTMIDNGRR